MINIKNNRYKKINIYIICLNILPENIHFTTEENLNAMAKDNNNFLYTEYTGMRYTLYTFMNILDLSNDQKTN